MSTVAGVSHRAFVEAACTTGANTRSTRASSLPGCLHERNARTHAVRASTCAHGRSQVQLSSRYGAKRNSVLHSLADARGRVRASSKRPTVKAGVHTSPSRCSKYDGHEEGRASNFQQPAASVMAEPITMEALRAEQTIGTHYPHYPHRV
eukprot:6249783-Pyramimonas_sp.AAC.1